MDKFLVKLRRPKAPIQNNVWRQSDNCVRFPSIEKWQHCSCLTNEYLNHFVVTLLPEFYFFRNHFQRNILAEKSKDECSKTIKPISKFLSHIKPTRIKLWIHNTFTKFSKSWHIPFNDCLVLFEIDCNLVLGIIMIMITQYDKRNLYIYCINQHHYVCFLKPQHILLGSDLSM